ncbi:hypothetical protein DS893_13570 [Vibrionales bacterium C3R12]|nr:hypothetical protein DS893_13570 [Vibrionales bacterium C3R12]
MITALYASILASIMIWLAIEVIKQRRSNKVAYSDGGVEGLQIARSAQSNAMDYIPITLILMALVEFNGAPSWLLLVIGRVMHAKGLLKEKMSGRVNGMKLTFLAMVSLIVLNIVYLPFEKLW